MDICPFHKKYIKTNVNNERHNQQNSTSIHIPYCTHKHSPLSERYAKNGIGVSSIITCAGDFDKCQVPKALFDDFK